MKFKFIIPLVVAVLFLICGIFTGLFIFGDLGGGDAVLSAPEIVAMPATYVDYGDQYEPDIITGSLYGDSYAVMKNLSEIQTKHESGRLKEEKALELIREAFSELGAFSLYYTTDTPITQEIDGVKYGAYVEEGEDPIGGGKGYSETFTTGDYVVSTLDELVEALSKAQSGEVVFITGDSVIDVSSVTTLTLGEGVTLASNRGYLCEDGSYSTGARLYTVSTIYEEVIYAKDGSRVSGIVLEGRNQYRHMEHHARSFDGVGASNFTTTYYSLPVVNGRGINARNNVRVDNCEISGFGYTGILLDVDIKNVKVDHCYIHHNQTHGLGYGVVHSNGAESVIEYCLFNYNRHSIAASGGPTTGYIARFNIEMGDSLEHCFDIHGGADRGDGTDIAGTYCEMYNNTFLTDEYPYWLRGVPEDYQIFYHNICIKNYDFYSKHYLINERATLYDNIFGGVLVE